MMRTLGFLWLASSLVLVGCVHTKEIGYGEAQTPPEEMVALVTGEDVIVNLRLGQTAQGEALALTADTLWLHLAESDSIRRLPMSEVESIETSASATGPVLGVVLGGAVGAGIGALIGNAHESETSPPGWGPTFRGMATGIGAAMGGVIGVVAGVVVGANTTPSRRFVLPYRGTDAAMSQENMPTAYVKVIVKRILEETETSITIPWADGKVTLPKSEIAVTHTKDGIEIRVPRSLWYGKR